MANFTSLSQVDARIRTLMATKVWVVGHSARNRLGQIIARFIRYMKPSAPDAGGWVETQDDTVE